jgi:hypothetical protein
VAVAHRVTETETQRWLENKSEREERAQKLKAHMIEQYKKKGLEVPSDIAQ